MKAIVKYILIENQKMILFSKFKENKKNKLLCILVACASDLILQNTRHMAVL